MDQTQKETISIQPYSGVVTVSFSDAIVASTDRALLVRSGGEPLYYIPFEDIYFDFMRRSEESDRDTPYGRQVSWGVFAVGESADDVLRGYEIAGPGYEQLSHHAAFVSNQVTIQTTPTPDPARQV